MANETEKNGASGSTVVDENRGQDDARQYPKKRGMSKDVVGSLDKRVAGVETSMAELKTQINDVQVLDNVVWVDPNKDVYGSEAKTYVAVDSVVRNKFNVSDEDVEFSIKKVGSNDVVEWIMADAKRHPR
ncbi:hypothetical protein Tco_1335661 [Tanacetum coccineum]